MKESLVKNKNANLIQFEKNKITFILCDCKNKILMIEYNSEYELGEFCIYETSSSYRHKMSFWQKMRYIYVILTKGQIYSEQIVLSNNQIKDIGSFLLSCIS